VRRALLVLLALALAAPLLAACGRVGPPRPPGPPEQITFPRTYPAR
jgi:predicted small lipoprotein YifL